MGGVGSRVSLWTWPALVAACARGRLCVLVLVPGVGAGPAGARHSWCIVARMRKLPLATVTLVCWSQRCFALLAAQPVGLALLNLGLVELLEVRLDDRAVELPADTAEVGEDSRQAPQRRVEQLAQPVVLGMLVGFSEFGGVARRGRVVQ